MSLMSKSKGYLFLASSLCDGLEDNNIMQVTTLLLNKDANPNTLIPSYGVTPFHLVIGNDSEAFAEEVTKLFLRHGGNPNVKSMDGLTPVHVAAAWGRVTVLEMLLANGGDALCLDYEGRSPFHYAFDGKYYGAITMLGKYCENITKEFKPTKHKITFNKLLVNDGDVVAEYAALLNTDTLEEFQTDEKNRFSDVKNKCFYFNDNQSDIKDAEHRLREEMDKEKCLLNQIINQLSSSLNSKSKEVEISNEHKHVEDSQCLTSPVSALNVDDNLMYDMKDKFLLKAKTKKRCVTPRYKRRVFAQTNNNKAPLSPLQDPNDSIISKSPNFPMGNTIEREQRFFTPKLLNRESKFRTYTPCVTRTGSFRSDEFNLGKTIARSTPRRKQFHRQYSSSRKFKKNNVLNSSDSTSPDSSTNSLSPNENRHPRLPYKLNKNISKNLAIRLYDDDVPKSPNFNEKYKLKGLASELSDLENLNIKEEAEGRKTDSMNVNVSFHGQYLKEIKSNDTLNSYKENYNMLSSSFKTQSFISVQEEYKYEDPDEGIAFLERRIYTIPPCKPREDFVTSNTSWPESLNLSTNVVISSEELRKKLINLGDNPGPITSTTKRLYLKRLIDLEKTELKPLCHNTVPPGICSNMDDCNFEIKSSLTYGDWVNNLGRYKIIEKTIFKEFCYVDPSRKWREGINKTCFNYLLLDPRVTKDLPCRVETMTKSAVWTTFLSAIFYVGKGTRNRPYSHLKDAFEAWVSTESTENAKIQQILNIWNDGHGVVCLHIFQNVIPVEAYTREAAMIDALGIKKLRNCKNGEYYGIAATWNIKEKCNFGRYLLHQAMQIFLYEGERQILPHNL